MDFKKGEHNLFLQGNCDDVVRKLVKDVGWTEEFEVLLKERAAL
jgi:hypothetical protein